MQGPVSQLPTMIFGYTVLLHIGLPIVTYALYRDAANLENGAIQALFSTEGRDALFYLAAAAFAALALVLPRKIADKASRQAASAPRPTGSVGSMARHPLTRLMVPYMVRLTLFEACTLAGFVFGVLRGAPLVALPFAAVGLLGTLLSPPSVDFLERLAGMAPGESSGVS